MERKREIRFVVNVKGNRRANNKQKKAGLFGTCDNRFLVRTYE